MDINKDLELLLRYVPNYLGLTFFQRSCLGPRPVFHEEFAIDGEEFVSSEVFVLSEDLLLLSPISHDSIYKYLVEVSIELDNQLFKENYGKQVRVKPMIKRSKSLYLVKCFSYMKNFRYTVLLFMFVESYFVVNVTLVDVISISQQLNYSN